MRPQPHLRDEGEMSVLEYNNTSQRVPKPCLWTSPACIPVFTAHCDDHFPLQPNTQGQKYHISQDPSRARTFPFPSVCPTSPTSSITRLGVK